MQPIMSPQPETVTMTPITQPEGDINTPEPTMQAGDVRTSPLTLGEGHQPHNDMAETITPELNKDVYTEPSILDILEAE